MNDSPLQSALREWRRHLTHPATLTALGSVALVTGVAGPFGTSERLSVLPRLGYWAVLVLLTYALGALLDQFVRLRMRRFGFWPRTLVAAAATGLCVVLVVSGVTYALLGWRPDSVAAASFVVTTFSVGAVIAGTISVVSRQMAPTLPGTPQPPRILNRLPLDKRAPLVALSVEDHYVRVQTTKAEELLLMRLSDAMNEVGDTPGAQVHRSHWAAWGQVQSARKSDGRATLTMTTGAEIPVSRSRLDTVRKAGLLP